MSVTYPHTDVGNVLERFEIDHLEQRTAGREAAHGLTNDGGGKLIIYRCLSGLTLALNYFQHLSEPNANFNRHNQPVSVSSLQPLRFKLSSAWHPLERGVHILLGKTSIACQ